jgi:hypothetical protein
MPKIGISPKLYSLCGCPRLFKAYPGVRVISLAAFTVGLIRRLRPFQLSRGSIGPLFPSPQYPLGPRPELVGDVVEVNAVVALKDIAQDVSCPASARVSAARTVLELAIKGVELEDLAARVEELESQVTRV